MLNDTVAVDRFPAASVAVSVAVYLPLPRPLAGSASVPAPGLVSVALPCVAASWRVQGFAPLGLRFGTAMHLAPFLIPGAARVTTAVTFAASDSENVNVARRFFLPALASLTAGLPENAGAV